MYESTKWEQDGKRKDKKKKKKKKKRLMWEGWIGLNWVEFEGSLCIMHSLFKTYDTKMTNHEFNCHHYRRLQKIRKELILCGCSTVLLHEIN